MQEKQIYIEINNVLYNCAIRFLHRFVYYSSWSNGFLVFNTFVYVKYNLHLKLMLCGFFFERSFSPFAIIFHLCISIHFNDHLQSFLMNIKMSTYLLLMASKDVFQCKVLTLMIIMLYALFSPLALDPSIVYFIIYCIASYH